MLFLIFYCAGLNGMGIPDGLVFDYPTLLATTLPVELQGAIFFLLLLGFAVKAPVFPLHTWLPTIAMEGPASIAAIMTGLKLGVYGLIRFTVPLAPAALAGVVLGAAYFLGICRRAFLGPIHNSAVSDAVDLRARELVVIVVMGILILVAGFYPDSVLELTRVASEEWVGNLPGK
jgi:NADH:ubiquinone oxidoreductase subunit 4 (subunit M)